MIQEKNLSPGVIALSCLVFFAGWTLRVAFLHTSHFGEWQGWLIGFLVQAFWWPCFAFFLIARFDMSLNIPLKELLSTPPKIRIFVPALGVTLAYNLLSRIADNSSFGTDMPFYDLFITVMTVGFFEESVFRGWFLNAVSVYTGERMANVISAVLFSLVHVPGWIRSGASVSAILYFGLSIFAVGLFFGYIFRRSRSIWTGAIVHSVWDMLNWIP